MSPSPTAIAATDAPALSRALPTVVDVNGESAYWSGVKKLRRLRGLVEEGLPVWWRRSGFFAPAHRDTPPKWHVLRARRRPLVAEHRWEFEWVAQCGYSSRLNAVLDPERDFRKTAPTCSERCKKCVEILDDIKRQAAAASETKE